MVSRLSDSSKQKKNQKLMKEYRNSILIDLSQDLEKRSRQLAEGQTSDDYDNEEDDDDDIFATLTPSSFKQLHLFDLLSTSKFAPSTSNIAHLMSNFEPLLREDTMASRRRFAVVEAAGATGKKRRKKGKVEETPVPVLTREEQLRELDEITGKMYKLSDFIDPEFLEQCLAQPVTGVAPVENADEVKRPVCEFVQELEGGTSDNWLFAEMERSFGNKR